MEQRICLNLASLKHVDYESALTTAAKAGFYAVGLQEVPIEQYVASGRDLAGACAFLNSLGLAAPEINFFSGWIYARGEARIAAFIRFARFCELATALGSRIIIVTTGSEGTPDEALANENYAELCRVAGEQGLVAALECVPWSAVKTIADVWRMVERTNHPAAGIVLDIFNIMKGGSSLDDIRTLPAEKIAIVHVNDLIETGEDVITLCRKRRVLPGEGRFPLREFIEAVRATGFDGWYALEILNEKCSQEDPTDIARRSFASMKALLG
jgi:4-hydroxyphenylpyruvate dioxygenase